MSPFNGSTQQFPPEVISLIRFSDAGQVSDDRAGIEGQRRVNETSALFHGLKIRREVVIVDVSGANILDDPDFNGILAELPDPTLAGVLVPEQSRLIRPETFDDWPVLGHFQRNKKLIYTPTGRIDPNTPEGRMTLTMGGMSSGEELHTLRTRFARGKNTKRAHGEHVGGDHTLPKTVRYVRQRDPRTGRIVSARWELVPLEVERMQRAFQLLFEGDSYEVIAEKIGGGWTGSGLHRCMTNPVHIGIRRYEWEATGPKHLPVLKAKSIAKGKKAKKRRKLEKRKVPVDVPTRADLESGKAQPVVEPILTLAQWDQAQAIMAVRMTNWRKSKLKNEGRERFVGNGISYCSCGLPLYGRYGSRGSHLDAYYCKSRFPAGKGCGMESIKRVDLDAAIEETVSMLLNIDFLMGALKIALALQQAAPDPSRAKREEALAKRAEGRKSGLEAMFKGEITREEFKEQMAVLEKEVRALESMVPAPVPQADPKLLMDLVVRTFTEFAFLTFAQKRDVLRGAVKSIIVDSHARAITTVVISGGFLGRGANSVQRSRASNGISAIPDLTIRFPHPVVIADSYVDRRGANGHHPNTIATQWRPIQ